MLLIEKLLDFELELKSLKAQFEEKNNEVRALKQQEINLKKRELELEEKAKDQELLIQQQLLEKQKEILDTFRLDLGVDDLSKVSINDLNSVLQPD